MDVSPPSQCINVAIAIVFHAGRILICRRPSDAVLGGYWEFPGGKVEPGESIESCLARELREELAIVGRIRTPLPVIEHTYPHGTVRLHPFLCDLAAGEPRALASTELKWIDPIELRDHRFPPANAGLLESLRVRLASEQPI